MCGPLTNPACETKTAVPGYSHDNKPLLVEARIPVSSVRHSPQGICVLDFGRCWFGTLEIDGLHLSRAYSVTLTLGEAVDADGMLRRPPPGTVRLLIVDVVLNAGKVTRITIPGMPRHTEPKAVRLPAGYTEVMPFRVVEWSIWPDELQTADVSLMALESTFDPNQTNFESSDPALNRVWELCLHTLRATSFCGVYVDGDRERIPYEGDAYVNLLSDLAVQYRPWIARQTLEHLVSKPTWPTEWTLLTAPLAYQYWLHSGDKEPIREHYELLKRRTLHSLIGADGLLDTAVPRSSAELAAAGREEPLRTLIDWPHAGGFSPNTPGECDGHEIGAVDTVVQAYLCHSLSAAGALARVLGKDSDCQYFTQRFESCHRALLTHLFSERDGRFIDSLGSKHSSAHANFYPLAFGLVPADKLERVSAFVLERGMVCSPYGAQFLLQGLYRSGRGQDAMKLITAQTARSWMSMLANGASITWEAWSTFHKPNLDWNHAWSTAPTNLIARYVTGLRPLTAGHTTVEWEPNPSGLTWFRHKIPTAQGCFTLEYESTSREATLRLSAPSHVAIHFRFPGHDTERPALQLSGKELSGTWVQSLGRWAKVGCL
ncbi:MAG: hypothetical protein SFY80_03325 [Verrucomicrobiota bacterium]|nr:hypothetical protein [Verrucomicrobiota bacterium]